MDGESKDSIRRKIWDYLERNDIADFPRPVYHRIPNFKGAAAACERLQSMDVFRRARVVKVNPDKPQQQARFRALEAGKILLVPTPRLKKGLFNRIVPPPGANKSTLYTCSSSRGVREFSSPVGLDAKIKVDVVIIGSVAVSPQGYRIGKGEGYADMEFAMMSSMGAVDEETVVVTTVHDCQVLDDLPESLFGEHDLGVDIILTPTRAIYCRNKRPRPCGIHWQLLTQEKFQEIPILKILREREANQGKDVRLREEISREGHHQSAQSLSLGESISENRIRNGSSSEQEKDLRSRDNQCQSLDQSHRIHDHSVRNRSLSPDHSQTGAKEYFEPTSNRLASSREGNRYRREEKNNKTGTKTNSSNGKRTSSGQRSHDSSGPKPSSNRKRDLGNMFAWSK